MIQVAHLSSSTTWFWLGAVSTVLLGMVLVAWSLRSLALRAAEESQSLEGDEVQLSGVVKYESGANVAFKVEVDERGEERSVKHGIVTHWQEVARRVLHRPFYVQLAIGARVRVEPSSETVLADTLDEVARFPAGFRTRVSTLSEGEKVWVHGALTEGQDAELPPLGYRDTQRRSRVLRASTRVPLTISTEPLDAEFLGRARAHQRFALLALAGLLFWATVAVAPVASRALARPESAVVTSVVPHYYRGRVASYDVECRANDTVMEARLVEPPALGSRIPVRIGSVSSQVGEEATLHFLWVALSGVAIVTLAVAYRDRVLRQRPWYRQKSLSSVERGPILPT